MKKIIVTGGLGQIGSHITELLLQRGDKVIVIDNLETGRKEHLESHENLEIIIDTIADRKMLDKVIGDFRPDAIVHTAASYKDPSDWYSDSLTNCVGGANVIDLAKKYNVKLYVDDVFNYRTERKDIKNLTRPIEVVWNKVSDNTLYDLMYHDLYLLWPSWAYSDDIKFSYGNSDDRIHKINNIDFTNTGNSNDALFDMIKEVLQGNPDYEYNKTISLMCNKVIDKLNG